MKLTTSRLSLIFATFFLALQLPALALDVVVDSATDDGTGITLREAIEEVNAAGGGGHTITFASSLAGETITWASNPVLITAGVSIDGSAASGLTISGGDTYRVFFVDAASQSVEIANLTIADGEAFGGFSASQANGGGGGLGAGAGLFVNQGDVSLNGVNFTNNATIGGPGGGGLSTSFGTDFFGGAGGGGLGGAAGATANTIDVFGGTGGGGFYGTGGASDDTDGGGGGGGFGGDGGDGGSLGNAGGGGGEVNNGSDGTGSGGGSGASDGGGDGGDDGNAGGAGSEFGGGGGGGGEAEGGDGGRFGGGGGGGGGANTGGAGGDGGEFGGGGGGGAGGAGGDGGFGGGGGASGVVAVSGDSMAGGTGGFGGGGGGGELSGGGSTAYGGTGGAGDGAAGGGGAALGGAIFVRGTNGATLTLSDVSETGSTVTPGGGGLGSAGSGSDGSALGSGMFLMNNDITIEVSSGTQTMEGDIVESTLDEDGSALAGSSVEKTGSGTLVLTGTNDYSGGTTITEGTLQLGDGGTTGSLEGDVANSGTLVFNRSDDIDFDGTISGTGDVTKEGAGDLALNAANTHSGTTTISEGTITLGDADALQNSVVATDLDNALDFNGFSDVTLGGLSGSGDVDADSLNLTLDGDADATHTGDLTGIETLTKSGNGDQIITSLNNSVTSVTVDSGELEITSSLVTSADVAVDGTLSANGALISNPTGSGTISANGNLLLGDGTSSDGYSFDGTLEVGANSVSLLDDDAAELGTATTIDGGTLTSTNGILLGSGETLTGEGTVNNAFENLGTVTGQNAGLTFTGIVEGDGDFLGDVTFEGVYSPGNSPAEVDLENPTFDFVLEIELAGLTAGTEFDFLNILGDATLGGVLDLSYLSGFTASEGDLFLFLSGDYTGTFSSIIFPDAQNWFISYDDDSISVGVVPEPTTGALLIAGLSYMALRRRR